MERQDGKTWRNWLQHDLAGYLNRDPQAIPAITLTPPSGSPGLVMVRDHTLVVPGTGLFDLTQYGMQALCTALIAQGWGAELSPGIPADLAATALVDTGYSALSPVPLQNVAEYPALAIPGSVLWQVVRPLSETWESMKSDLTSLLLGILEGPWLDNLGTYLQVPRIGGEPDSLYQTRLYGLAITGSPNGVAMEAFLAALGYSVAVTDTTPGQFTATVQWPTQPPQGFVYDQSQIQGMIDTLKAVGVIATVVFASQLSDTLMMSDSVTVTATPLTAQVWGGTLPDGTGAVQGFTWNEAVWQ
ncbi:hypothetical protein [Sulfobacillus harzensis]|uniref:Uncharacterized protein n=1 Tax=Sulfobacillus harzensis TaxID=2729629 RepID=A0A7Y0L065_9FIRM|nr:hypothetical protein [Sulfobacillus harzensis]NMP20785.1 hypothetical protein [Sulfobacillus harzensis]